MVAMTPDVATPGLGERAAWAVRDTLTLTKRELLLWVRVPAYIMFTVVQPVMFVLMFRYVFGGAIPVKVRGGYVSFLMPGIIGQTAAFASFATAIALARQSQLGVIDRFRAMPMARGAVLGGRLCADAVRMMITILVIVGVGYAVGFRFQNGFAAAVGMVLIAEAFGLAVCCVSGAIGLAIRDEESVQAFGLIWLFPLTFVSSAFVPVQSMPGALPGIREPPAGDVRDRHHARARARWPAGATPVAGARFDRCHLRRVRSARGQGLQASRLSADGQSVPIRPGGQYVKNAVPMIHPCGTGPQKRLSSDHPRLSPIM